MRWRLGAFIPLPGPFYLSGSAPLRRQVWHAWLPGWQCRHNHRSEAAALRCRDRQAGRRPC